ncbi:MAG: hypothetical protein AB8B91_09385 [Rubripirellula sp.]
MLDRPHPFSARRSFAFLLAGAVATSFSSSDLLGQEASDPIALNSPRTSAIVIVDTATGKVESTLPAGGLQLQAPLNAPSSTAVVEGAALSPEEQIARRLWLLEKLTKPKTEPSIKMNPPAPPAELPDPPSMNRLQPKPVANPVFSAPKTNTAGPAPSYVGTERPKVDPFAERTEPKAKSSFGVPSMDISGKSEAVLNQPAIAPAKVAPKPAPSIEEFSAAEEGSSAHVSDDAASVSIRRPSIDRDRAPLSHPPVAQAEVAPSLVQVEPVPQEEPVAVPLDYAGFPKQKIRLTNSVYRMRNTIRQSLIYHYTRPEVANERSNWGMLHSIMVYGIDTKVRVERKSYSAIAWMAGNNACRGQRILTDESGRLSARSGVGLQGHQAQMLAVFSLCGVPIDYPLYAGDNQYTVKDLVESEMLACKSGEELTFTLIGLAHYLDTDAVWQDERGESWDFERLIREELAQPIVGAACGGTHRLMGYAHALRKRRAEGKSITGEWKRAETYTRDFTNYVYQLQNRDGSISTDWFEGREDNGDMDRKIQTTGHMVEWLLTITPDSQLQNRRLVSAINFLASTMYKERGHEWKIGPKGHALRSLAMFYDRVYQSGSAWQSNTMARKPSKSRR